MNLTSALTAAAALAVTVLPFTVSAQDAPAPSPTPAVDGSGAGAPPAPPAPDANGQRGRRGGNPEDFRKRMLDRVKTMLKASDDEFAVIQPLMEKVYTKQREAGGGGRGFGGPLPPRGNGGPEGQQGPDARGGEPDASRALREALDKDTTSPAEIQQKLTALREQRKKAAAELAAAREDLKKVLTARQEATLVHIGLLE